jgi:alpha-beta hydrolase superfamily lysophospholipase
VTLSYKLRVYLVRTGRILALIVTTILLTLLGVRAWGSLRGEPLQPWHLHIPDELKTAELTSADWAQYLDRENLIMEKLREEVMKKLPPESLTLANRYAWTSPLNPERFPNNWNRSIILKPEGKPAGAAVLLHGLTDSPYSMRHLAAHYRDAGYVALVIRLPGHGTVPAGLVKTHWKTWSAATALAVKEASRHIHKDQPLHIVGYSNGGALAVKYALDAMDDPSLRAPNQLLLISPMIGVTDTARFAGVAGWPALFPAFAKAAWLSIQPEFNPFKYQSFPVNGPRQSSLLTRALQTRVAAEARSGRLAALPPILTFQSVVDAITSAPAVLSALYAHLPPNGSELVLFDINRNEVLEPLMRSSSASLLQQILPPTPRNYAVSIVTNRQPNSHEVIEDFTPASATQSTTRELGIRFPPGVFSLSHVSLPFPMDDSLYGLHPAPKNEFGISLGTLAPRGERNVLSIQMDSLLRMTCNPFFPYLLEKIDATKPQNESTSLSTSIQRRFCSSVPIEILTHSGSL